MVDSLKFGAVLLCLFTLQATNALVHTWRCQMPGRCVYCSQCSTCIEGPEGFPGGCGFCRQCSSIVCPQEPECVVLPCKEPGNNTVARQGSIPTGDILVLNVNSWFLENGFMIPPRVTTAVGCAEECGRLEECNAWSYCHDPQGCGSGCDEVKKYNVIPKNASCTEYGPYANCTKDGKYPQLTCTLKHVTNTSEAVFNATDKGWTSGVLSSERQNDTKIIDDRPSLSCTV